MTEEREASELVMAWINSLDDFTQSCIAERRDALIASVCRALAARRPAVPPCGTCGGIPPSSGLPCVCGGTNTIYAEVQGLREHIFNMSRPALTEAEWEAVLRAVPLICLSHGQNECPHCDHWMPAYSAMARAVVTRLGGRTHD